MLKSTDIKLTPRLGKIEWLLLGGILITGALIAVLVAVTQSI